MHAGLTNDPSGTISKKTIQYFVMKSCTEVDASKVADFFVACGMVEWKNLELLGYTLGAWCL